MIRIASSISSSRRCAHWASLRGHRPQRSHRRRPQIFRKRFCMRSKVKQHHGTLLVDSDLDRLQNYLRVDPRKLRAKGTKSVRARVCNLSDFVPGLRVETLLEALKAAFERAYGPYETLEAQALPWADIRPTSKSTPPGNGGWARRRSSISRSRTAFPGAMCKCSLPSAYPGAGRQGLYRRAGHGAVRDIRACLLGRRFGSAPLAEALETSQKAQVREVADFIRMQAL